MMRQHSTGVPQGPLIWIMTDDNHFDVLVIGTGVTESVLSAALSRAGKRVLHIDTNAYYGAEWTSLTLSELSQWATKSNADLAFPREPAAPGFIPSACKEVDRHYSIALRPALLPARGPMIEALIRSNVASYATFRLLGRTGIYDGEHLECVPKSKSDIFRDKRFSLVDKRRLMRFLQTTMDPSAQEASDDHVSISEYLRKSMGFDAKLERAVIYGVALCWDSNEPSTSAMDRTRYSLSGLGRYGDAAFLVAQYGGAGELTQGFCRSSAVQGGVFILGHDVHSLERTESVWALRMNGIPESFTADQVAAPAANMPHNRVTAAPSTLEHVSVLITDASIDWAKHMPLEEDEPVPETALLVFPPTKENEHAVMVLAQGEGTFSCPKGQFVYYVTTYRRADGTSARTCLAEAVAKLHSLLTHDAPWIAEMYCSHTLTTDHDGSSAAYVDTSAPPPSTSMESSLCLSSQECASITKRQAVPNMTESLDLCVEAAEHAFWRIVGEQHRDPALRLARARLREHAPSEYQGRGGVDPDGPPVEVMNSPVEIEFFAPQSTLNEDAL